MGVSKIEQYVIDTVRVKRQEKGISQVQLAHLLNKSEGFIANVESTKRTSKYNLNHINELAIIFQCSPRDFLPKEPVIR